MEITFSPPFFGTKTPEITFSPPCPDEVPSITIDSTTANVGKGQLGMKRNTAVEPEYVTVKDAEVMTGISAWTWRKRAYAGRIASVKDTRHLLIPVSEIRRVMAEGYRPALVEP